MATAESSADVMAKVPVDLSHTFKMTVPAEMKGTCLHMLSKNTQHFSQPLYVGGPRLECTVNFNMTSYMFAQLNPPSSYSGSLDVCLSWPNANDLNCTVMVYILKSGYRWSPGSLTCNSGTYSRLSFNMGTIGDPFLGNARQFDILLDVRAIGKALAPLVKAPSTMVHTCKMTTDGMKLFDSGLFSDVEVKCADQTFKCHKAVLANRSDVLARMLSSDFKEGQENVVVINEMEPEVLRIMLHYIYSGLISREGISVQLFRAAHLYNVGGLANECSQVLAGAITADNFYETLELAHLYDDKNLFEHAIGFFKTNKEMLTTSDKWKSMEDGNSLLKAVMLYL